MILDTSALLAILQMEPEAEEMSAIVSSADVVRLSAASYVEASMCIERLADTVRKAMFEDVLREFEIRVEPVTFEQASAARQAFRDFGKGRHPAGLN